jgi:hypothetical protein
MKFAVLFLLLAVKLCSAQNLLIKKDGEHVPYKKLKKSNGYYEAIQDNKVKVKLLVGEVIGFYDGNLQKISYKKPLVKNNEKLLFPLNAVDTANGFQVLEREEVGKINLYKKEVFSGSGASSTSTTYYYAEKAEVFLNVFITGLGNKKDDLKVLKSLISDDDLIAEKIAAESFQLNEKNLLRTIRDYNLSKFTNPEVRDYAKIGTVSFYTTVGLKLKESVLLKINDSLEYRMPTSYYPLPIKIPLEVPSKVCIISEHATSCSLIQPIPFAVDAYELIYLILDRTFEVRGRFPHEVQNYLTRARAK